ncbi:MAG: PAS domain S-box protein [Pseudomonadota bacterium]
MRQETTEEDLRDSLSMYKDLVSNIPVGVCRFRMKALGGWQFDFVNSRFCKLTGLSREDILDNSETAFRLIHPDDLPEFISLIESVEKAPGPFAWVGRIMVEGETRWIRVESSPTQMDNGDVVWTGHITNITDRKKAEESLEKRIVALTGPLDQANCIEFDELFNIEDIQRLQDQFAQATGVASIITHTNGRPITRPSNFRRLCEDIIRQTEKGLANCYKSDAEIGRYCSQGPTVQPCLSSGLWDAGASITVNGRHIANWLIGQVRDETHTEEKMRAYSREIGVDEETFLDAFSEVPTMKKEQFEAVAKTLFTLANLLSNVAHQNVQQARLIIELKQRKEDLRESEQRYRAVFDNAAVAIDTLDRHGRITAVNPALTNMLSYTEDEIKRLTFEEITHPDDRQISKQNLETLMAGHVDSYRLEKRYLRKDGEIVWGDLSTSSIKDAKGNHMGAVGVISEITERKRIEGELRQRKEELATILDTIPAMVWIGLDPECRVITGNRLVNELFGVPSETNVSQTAAQKGQALFIKHLKTDGTEYRVDELPMQQSIASGQRILDHEIEYRLSDGRKVFALGNAVPLFDDKGEVRGSVAAFLDISERKKIEHLLRTSEKLYRAVVDNLRFGIAVINRNMEIVTANDVLQQSYPRLRSQQAALCYQVYNDPPRSSECEDCPCALTFQDGQPHKIDREIVSQGLKRTHRIASYPVKDEHGEVELVIELSEDITESKLLQAQLFQSQKMEALGTLVGGIAHDFNNMLQIILGYSDLLLSDKRTSEPGYDELRTIIETAKGGADLVTKLLAFGQQAPIFPVNMDLNHQISQLSTLMSRSLPQVVQIDLDLAEEPTTIHADHGQIDQLVMNLAINAAEAMPNGGRLKIATKTVSLDDEFFRGHHGLKPGSYVLLSISDTGRGMDKETLARIFDPFFSTKQRGSTRGTGLGLSVVKGIVQQHGGHVDCQSEPGKGTEFRIYFPSIEEPLADVRSGAPTVQSGRTETILVVEDNIPVADLEQRFLASAGYTVIVATNGREALDIYRSRKEEISLVVLDLLMPEMSGRDCLMELLKIDPSVKVLIASGYAPEDELHKEIRPLVKGFLQKPFAMAELVKEVRSGLDID